MPNSTLTVLPDARAKSVSKQHLLGDPYNVSIHDLDPLRVDISAEHRRLMRQKLYLPNSLIHEIPKPVGIEALDSKYSYADETLPKWMSTMKDEYSSKSLSGFDDRIAHKLALASNSSHFVLGSIDLDRAVMKSSTKNDFVKPKYVLEPDQHPSHATEKRYSLTDFEGGELNSRKENRTLTKERDEDSKIQSSKDLRYVPNVHLGNEINDWKSISTTAMVSHPPQPSRGQTEYEQLEKKKSTVVDYPDLKLEKMASVNQIEFALSNTLDRSTLTYDNSLSKKSLKETHFILGKDENSLFESEYLRSFVPIPDSRSTQLTKQPLQKYNFIEEEQNQKMCISTQKQDYQSITNHERSNAQDQIKVKCN
jgi:hypothetical protein